MGEDELNLSEVPGGGALREESRNLQRVRDQAARYMEAVYGTNVWFAAPETFDNVLVRWIWALAKGHFAFAEEQMAWIENKAREERDV